MAWTPPARPRWVARLNAHGAAVGDPAALVSLDPEELLATAREGTGLDDFGGEAWRPHYDAFLGALAEEAHLHLAGRIVARSEILRTLRNRLRLASLWKRRPEILEEEIAPPVFVVGSPRSGTSILHELLALDTSSRAPLMWEMEHPVESLEGDRLRAVGHAETTFWHDLQPEYETMHANSGELPNECIFITLHEFLSDHWGGCHPVPSYEQYLAHTDQRPAYRYHRRFLQTLQQTDRRERWLLKAPSHLFQLAALFDVYPEARVIQTHRDPLKTLPSTLSLTATLKWMRSDHVELAGLGPRMAGGYAWVYQQEIEQRASGALPDERFVDVRYHDLVSDPADTVCGLYERLGWPLPADLEQRVRDYVAAKPRGGRGAHPYDLADWDLDAGAERERFAFYEERFAVPPED
ncbi:MAG: sulfotransferase family protein [Myxococcota bacterium]